MSKGNITLTSIEPRFLFISPDGIYSIVVNAEILGNNGIPVVPSIGYEGDHEGDDCIAIGSIAEEIPLGVVNLKDYELSSKISSSIQEIVSKSKKDLENHKTKYTLKPAKVKVLDFDEDENEDDEELDAILDDD